MQTALTLRKVSISPIVAISAILLAVTAGGASGYLVKSQLSTAVTTIAQPPVAAQRPNVAAPLALPDLLAQHEDSRLFITPAAAAYITQHEDSHLVIDKTVGVTDAVDRAVARANPSEPDAVDRALARGN
jgi:hypothetical protein